MTSEAVLTANEAFYRAFNEKDFEAMEEVWSSSEEVSCIHPGWNVLSGREDVLGSWRTILGNPDQPRIVFGGAAIQLLGDTALVVCRELVAGSPLAATNIFVNEAGSWKLVHHQSGPVYQQDQ
jgi:ketosteroid isomerase-like protein